MLKHWTWLSVVMDHLRVWLTASNKSLIKNSIPKQNIVEFCADTSNVMFGANRSASKLMKALMPNILNARCSCRLILLCSSYACLSIPKTLEDLSRDIHAHFSRSASSRDKYAEFQKFFECKALWILALGQTRWLHLHACMKRLIEHRDALIHYFIVTTFYDPITTNDLILSTLQSKLTKPYLKSMASLMNSTQFFNLSFHFFIP